MSNIVLVLNCGSSSLKYAITNADTGEQPISGQAESLGTPDASLTFKMNGQKTEQSLNGADHAGALQAIVPLLAEHADSIGAISAVGHRVVHGGERFTETALITPDVIQGIQDCGHLAPLHNPANLGGILAAQQAFPDVPHVAVFDTAFHQTMPKHAFLYAVPYDLYTDHAIRKYGMHGSSYRYITNAVKTELGIQSPNLIIAHLGNGGSVAAIAGGKSVDTTMGLTPLEGIVHGTRSGDIDPALPDFIANTLNIPLAEVTDMLWKKSGLLGLSQISHDCRTLEEEADNGNKQAQLALAVYAYRLAKHMAGMMVALPARADAIVFTGGIGENSSYIRKIVMGHLAHLGLCVDDGANDACIRGKSGVISTAESAIPCHVIPTNEELVIAQDAVAIAQNA